MSNATQTNQIEWTDTAVWLYDLVSVGIDARTGRKVCESRAKARGMERVTALTVYRALGLY